MKKSLKREIVEVLIAALVSIGFMLFSTFIFYYFFRPISFMMAFVISTATYATLVASMGGFVNFAIAILASIVCTTTAFMIFHNNCIGFSHHPVALPIFLVGACVWVVAAFRSLTDTTVGWTDRIIYGRFITEN